MALFIEIRRIALNISMDQCFIIFGKKWTYYYPITATDISNGPKNTNFHIFRISFMFLTHKFLNHKIGMPSHSKSNNLKLNNLKITFFRPKIADFFDFRRKIMDHSFDFFGNIPISIWNIPYIRTALHCKTAAVLWNQCRLF